MIDTLQLLGFSIRNRQNWHTTHTIDTTIIGYIGHEVHHDAILVFHISCEPSRTPSIASTSRPTNSSWARRFASSDMPLTFFTLPPARRL